MAPIRFFSRATDDRSASYMPKVLLILAVIFTSARLIDLGMQWRAHKVASGSSTAAIVWNELPSLGKIEVVDKPVIQPEVSSDFSKESLEELNKILAAGADANKFVLYEFYANWSDPCKTMETTSLSNGQVKSLVDNYFLPVRVTDRFQETGKNPKIISELQKKYRVFAFPTLVIVDKNGKMVSTLVGNCNSLTTYRFLSRTLHSLEGRGSVSRSLRHEPSQPGCASIRNIKIPGKHFISGSVLLTASKSS